MKDSKLSVTFTEIYPHERVPPQYLDLWLQLTPSDEFLALGLTSYKSEVSPDELFLVVKNLLI